MAAVFVPAVDEGLDGGDEVFDRAGAASADGLAGDDPEEDLHHVQLRPGGGGEVHGDSGVFASHVFTAGCSPAKFGRRPGLSVVADAGAAPPPAGRAPAAGRSARGTCRPVGRPTARRRAGWAGSGRSATRFLPRLVSRCRFRAAGRRPRPPTRRAPFPAHRGPPTRRGTGTQRAHPRPACPRQAP